MLHVQSRIKHVHSYKDSLALLPAAAGSIGVHRHRGEREAEEGEGKRERGGR